MDVPGEALSSTPLSPAHRALKEITFGSIAGMVSKVFEHPFDLTKVRLQSQVLDSSARFNGPLDCMRQTFMNEGILGLYRGLPAPVVGAMAENAALFLSYRELQNLIRRYTGQPEPQKLPLSELALAAAGAGAITSLVLTPVELVKCKMQVQMLVPQSSSAVGAGGVPARLPGPIPVLMSVIRTSGFSGLWLGQSGTFIRETGGGVAWFGTKEYVASLLVSRRTGNSSQSDTSELLTWESALSGACAGAAFNLTLFPADTVKSAMQTEEELRPKKASSPKSTFIGTLRQMYKAQGIKGLYAGCGITIARSVVSSAMIFVIYDELNRRFG
ncbi:mitochondrial carrier [Dendrothele bispora CBS 962.96]|uniref:Mitochondrial carrier n=1 Tax=Dendrothele bispora (strain CBS 962.96) TaxID=1314807 RepID=A0A4S8MWA0_DENBC|nr:mitochondrial carrier [Dendrothele bispora CBS 962.96]